MADRFTKCIQFATSTCRENFKDFIGREAPHLLDSIRIKLVYPLQISKWRELCEALCTGTGCHSSIYPYLKSCEYAEKIVEENNKELELKFKEIEQENQEFKCLVYNLLDQFNELKEHNKSLSSRVFELESLLEKKEEVPNLIDF